MSVNNYLPHLLVIPEDDANRDIVTGFLNHLSVNSHKIKVENVAGGWKKATDKFVEEYAEPMRRKFDQRHVLILIDLDGREHRLEEEQNRIPEDLRNRVFVMGSQVTPERLSASLGRMSKERIGEALADECVGRGGTVWQSEMLAHNQPELQRMRATICPHLLESSS
jgi:hypothetical protein